jgi:ABC-2 type transport system ATP-binding protein
MASIRVEGLGKSFRVKRKRPGFWGSMRSLVRAEYEEKDAVEGVTFDVRQGESLAFLGPNGAGKSTTIKMLTGILHPSAGKAEVLGFCPWTERTKLAYRVGSVFGQKSQLWYHLPPLDTFELMSRIYELRRSDYLQRRDELIERFGLGPYLNTAVRKLSLGERMRCEIAAALLHRPQVIFLDEPTIGLDVVVKRRIREVIRELNREEGTTIFLTSHDAGDVELLCERSIVINYGKVIYDDSVEAMKRSYLTTKTIRLVLGDGETEEAAGGGSWSGVRGVRVLECSGERLTLSVDTAAVTIEEVLAQLMARHRILDMTVEDPPMEDIITRMYAGAEERSSSHERMERLG